MLLIKAAIVFNNGDIDEKVVCRVNYDARVVGLYNESFERVGFIPFEAIMKFEFRGYVDSEKGDVAQSELQADEGW
jgi:hypothetical protein